MAKDREKANEDFDKTKLDTENFVKEYNESKSKIYKTFNAFSSSLDSRVAENINFSKKKFEELINNIKLGKDKSYQEIANSSVINQPELSASQLSTQSDTKEDPPATPSQTTQADPPTQAKQTLPTSKSSLESKPRIVTTFNSPDNKRSHLRARNNPRSRCRCLPGPNRDVADVSSWV